MRLVEIKDINGVLNQIKKDIEYLASIEIKDSEEVKELKKKLSELKTAREVLKQLNQPTDVIDKQITDIENQLKQKEIKLTEKQRLLIKLLEHYGVKINKINSGSGAKKKKIIIITEDNKVKEFSYWSELAEYLGVEVGKDSARRVVKRFLSKNKPKIKVIENNEVIYNGL